MPSPPARPEFVNLRARLQGLLPGGSIDVMYPPRSDPAQRRQFRQSLATRVQMIRRQLPAGWEYSIRGLRDACLTVTRLTMDEAMKRSRTAALVAARAHPYALAPQRSPDPYQLRVQRNATHLGTEFFDHLSPPVPGPARLTRGPHRRALKEALLHLEPGGSLHWPLPWGAATSGRLLSQERSWLNQRIDDFRYAYDPAFTVSVGVNDDKTGLVVRRPIG